MHKFTWLPNDLLAKTLVLLPPRSVSSFLSTASTAIPQHCYIDLFKAHLFKKLNIDSWKAAFNILMQGGLHTERDLTINRMYATFSAAYKYSIEPAGIQDYSLDITFPLFYRDATETPDEIHMFVINMEAERYPCGRLGFEYASELPWKWEGLEYNGEDEEGFENDVFVFDLYIDLAFSREGHDIAEYILERVIAIYDDEMVQSKLKDKKHYKLVSVSL